MTLSFSLSLSHKSYVLSDSFLSRACERFIVLPTERENNAVYYSRTNFLFLGKSERTRSHERDKNARKLQRQRGARRERERERERASSLTKRAEEEEEKKI